MVQQGSIRGRCDRKRWWRAQTARRRAQQCGWSSHVAARARSGREGRGRRRREGRAGGGGGEGGALGGGGREVVEDEAVRMKTRRNERAPERGAGAERKNGLADKGSGRRRQILELEQLQGHARQAHARRETREASHLTERAKTGASVERVLGDVLGWAGMGWDPQFAARGAANRRHQSLPAPNWPVRRFQVAGKRALAIHRTSSPRYLRTVRTLKCATCCVDGTVRFVAGRPPPRDHAHSRSYLGLPRSSHLSCR
ncbi:hypothetical protein CC78DRAFT_540397 [Lojkania enalia]|uniref:Uncharacterized protein n=1 Tax=Lojkania enalia TaxID=147567 RepID=A0A9P4KJV3_9PLEO|nr:hypothetical protein CC78DRAFT_540397 [Didymosphaeria enalia]